MNRIELLVTRYAQRKGITKTEFAKEAGVSRGALYKWFSGSVPDESALARLAKLLDTTTSDLRYGIPTAKQQAPIREDNWTLVLEMLLPPDQKNQARLIASTVEMFCEKAVAAQDNDPKMLKQMLQIFLRQEAV